MTLLGRRVLLTAAGCAGLCAVPAALSLAASSWPVRTVRLIVPFGVGSAPDVAARLFAQQLAARWGRPVVVDNRPGADGLIAVRAFAGAHDDHELLFSPAAPLSVFPYTQEKIGYDPTLDFVPISMATDTFGAIAVPASLNVLSLAAFIRLAAAQPGRFNWASGGGAFPTLLAGFFKSNDLQLVQVAYREQSLAIQDLVEGRIHVLATSLTALLPMARAGRIRILAVTSRQHSPSAPDIPTAAEAGHRELEFAGLVGLFGGRDMPATRRDAIATDMQAVAGEAALIDALAVAGQIARAGTPAEFAEAIDEQRARIQAILRLIGGRQ